MTRLDEDAFDYLLLVISMLCSKDPRSCTVSEFCLLSDIVTTKRLVEDITKYRELCTAALGDEEPTPEHQQLVEDTRARLASTLPEAVEYAEYIVELSHRLEGNSDPTQ